MGEISYSGGCHAAAILKMTYCVNERMRNMDPHNTMGAPYDPDPADELPDNQEPLNEDYLDDAVSDVETDFYDDPEDVPAEDRDQLREGVMDDMPGDTEQALQRELHSPNERRNSEDDPRYYDSDRNPAPDAAVGHDSAADATAARDMAGDMAADDPDIEQRIG